MIKNILPIILLLLAYLAGGVSAQQAEETKTPEPTQTPYIIYVVVTATPEPEPEVISKGEITEPTNDQITRPTPAPSISLVNGDQNVDNSNNENEIAIVNPNNYAGSVDELIQLVVATASAEVSNNTKYTAAGGTQDYSGTGGVIVHNSDGTTCNMNFQLISEPTYPAGAIIPRGEVFWKEWLIQNTGTCTWTPEWEFVFDSGWQIGNTRFHMNRTTEPGQTLNVRLAMVPDQQQDGNYYSTYIFEAPDGTKYGTITSSYTVKPASYFAKPTPEPKNKNKPCRDYRNCPPQYCVPLPPPPPHKPW